MTRLRFGGLQCKIAFIGSTTIIKYTKSERVCSLVVTRASVAHEVLGSTPCGSEFFRILRCCAFSGRRRERRQLGICGDFVNLENLLAQSSKMLIGVDFCVCVFIEGECACLISVL